MTARSCRFSLRRHGCPRSRSSSLPAASSGAAAVQSLARFAWMITMHILARRSLAVLASGPTRTALLDTGAFGAFVDRSSPGGRHLDDSNASVRLANGDVQSVCGWTYLDLAFAPLQQHQRPPRIRVPAIVLPSLPVAGDPVVHCDLLPYCLGCGKDDHNRRACTADFDCPQPRHRNLCASMCMSANAIKALASRRQRRLESSASGSCSSSSCSSNSCNR